MVLHATVLDYVGRLNATHRADVTHAPMVTMVICVPTSVLQHVQGKDVNEKLESVLNVLLLCLDHSVTVPDIV